MYAANDADETLRAHRGCLTWFLFALWLAVRNVILRETALGPVAQVIDKPPAADWLRSHSYYSGVRSCSAGASPSFSDCAFCVAN